MYWISPTEGLVVLRLWEEAEKNMIHSGLKSSGYKPLLPYQLFTCLFMSNLLG